MLVELRMPTLLLVRSGVLHPSLPSQSAARRALEHGVSRLAEPAYLRTVSGVNRPLSELPGTNPWGVALMFHLQRVTDSALGGLCDYVEGGGRLLALHGATASFKGSRRFEALIGRRFTGHDAVRPMTLRRAADAPASPADLPDRVTIVDEPYEHVETAPVTPWFTGEDQDPLVWTREHGRGRVAVFVPGHRAATFHEPDVVRILGALVGWLARGGGR